MKLVYPTIQTILSLPTDRISSLVVEEPGFFYELVCHLKQQWSGMDGNWVLSRHDEPVAISRNMELIIDCVDFDINRKTLLTKVLSALEKTGRDEEHMEHSQQLLAEIERYILDLSFDYEVEIQCDKISVGQILKSAGISIISDFDTLTDVLYSYMQLVREFDGEKVFVFVNLRSFVSQKELQAFADTVTAHEYRVLLLDNKAYPKLREEQRLIVDEDLCEI